jgi:hypothetical protein
MQCLDLERFLSKTVPDGDCLRWTGATIKGGYGQFWLDGRAQLAHIVAYTTFVGPYTQPTLDHQCDHPWCVNWDHLKPATHQRNILRGFGTAAINSRKTHCPKGHPLEGDNLLMDGGRRRCRICRTEYLCQRRRKSKSFGTSSGWRPPASTD